MQFIRKNCVISNQNPEKIKSYLVSSLKHLINLLWALEKYSSFSLILIESLSALLFINEDFEYIKELESVLKRLSTKSTIVVTITINQKGNLLGNAQWSSAITNNLFVSCLDSSFLEVVWYKYNIFTMQFSIDAYKE